MADDLFDDKAHARRTDPETSHEAAEAITPHLHTGRESVKLYFKEAGPDGSTDAEMHLKMGDNSSHLRSRRAELVDEGWIVDSGRRAKFGNERDRIVWVHRDYVDNPPPLRSRPRSKSEESKALAAEAHALRIRLRESAVAFHKEGRPYAEQVLREADEMIGRLIGR